MTGDKIMNCKTEDRQMDRANRHKEEQSTDMKSLMKKMHRGQKGLTLIELLIVVAILGIIAAVVIPNLSAFMVTGRISAANTEAENVKTASLAYYAENEAWPTSSADIEYLIAGTLTGNYTIDPDYGWLYEGGGWDDIEFTGGATGIDGTHGTWTRPVA